MKWRYDELWLEEQCTNVVLGWKSARPSAEREVAGSNTGKTRVLQKLASSLLKKRLQLRL